MLLSLALCLIYTSTCVISQTTLEITSIVSTDNFHGDYINKDIIEDIEDSLNDHHDHPKLAITPTLSTETSIITGNNLLNKQETNSVVDLPKINTSIENMLKDTTDRMFDDSNTTSCINDTHEILLSTKNTVSTNLSSNQTASISEAEDSAMILRCYDNHNYSFIFLLILWLAALA